MTHETKAGLLVSSAFVCLVGAVVYLRLTGDGAPVGDPANTAGLPPWPTNAEQAKAKDKAPAQASASPVPAAPSTVVPVAAMPPLRRAPESELERIKHEVAPAPTPPTRTTPPTVSVRATPPPALGAETPAPVSATPPAVEAAPPVPPAPIEPSSLVPAPPAPLASDPAPPVPVPDTPVAVPPVPMEAAPASVPAPAPVAPTDGLPAVPPPPAPVDPAPAAPENPLVAPAPPPSALANPLAPAGEPAPQPAPATPTTPAPVEPLPSVPAAPASPVEAVPPAPNPDPPAVPAANPVTPAPVPPVPNPVTPTPVPNPVTPTPVPNPVTPAPLAPLGADTPPPAAPVTPSPNPAVPPVPANPVILGEPQPSQTRANPQHNLHPGVMPNTRSIAPPAADTAPEPRPAGTLAPLAVNQAAPAVARGLNNLTVTTGPAVESFDEETHVCRPNDTFAAICREKYQSEKFDRALLMFNRAHPMAADGIRNEPPVLRPGQPVYVPPLQILQKRYAALIPDLGAAAPPVPATPAPVASGAPAASAANAAPAPANTSWASPQQDRFYDVKEKPETLWEIATRTLGNGERWSDIYRVNPGMPTNGPLPVGSRVRLPAN